MTMLRLRSFAVHVVGGGLLGLLVALETALAGRRFGFRPRVHVHEGGALGGCARQAAAPRCQLWLHRQGVLWAHSQPEVSLGLQRATRRLLRLTPRSVRYPPAFAVEPPGSGMAEASFRALDIEHRAIPARVFKEWFPNVALPDRCSVFRTVDATVDLTLAALELETHCRRHGVTFHRRRVARLDERHGRIRRLALAGGEDFAVAPDDRVILTCGAGIRPLLNRAGVSIPGLRHFLSTLLAAHAEVPALIAYLRGGINVVPHPTSDGRILDVFGDARRIELPPDADGKVFAPPQSSVDRLRRDVKERLGIALPDDVGSWSGVKAEIVPKSRVRSQSHHVFRVPQLENAWAALPGKMSQAAETARVLVAALLRDSLGGGLATPIWEQRDDLQEGRSIA